MNNREVEFGNFVIIVLVCAALLFVSLLGVYEITKDYTIVKPATNVRGSSLCMVFEEGELISHASANLIQNSYICYNPSTEQYSFCEPTFVECK